MRSSWSEAMNITEYEFNLLKAFLFNLSGIEIPDDKRYLFSTRLTDLVEAEGCKSFADFYVKLTLKQSDACRRLFVESMTTHESGFFRDDHPFRAFFENVLPSISKRKIAQAHFLSPLLRILSAGCGFGQEPYSIAMCMRRWLSDHTEFPSQNIVIIGIDISDSAIARAKKGLYSELEIGKYLTPEDRKKYFIKKSDRWLLTEDIRKMVSFERNNLDKPFNNFGTFDVIFCRNVIIYFPLEVRKQVVERLRAVLEPEGVLFLGSAESLFNTSNGFASHTVGDSTYYVKCATP
jgi:chemotaxis protein methyltransferase CheR